MGRDGDVLHVTYSAGAGIDGVITGRDPVVIAAVALLLPAIPSAAEGIAIAIALAVLS